MKSLRISVLCGALVVGALLGAVLGDTDDHHDEEYDSIDKRLNKITARIEHVADELDVRLNKKILAKAKSLAHRVHELEGPQCSKAHYDCGGEDHECVSRLLVCDGRVDCRNGDDEKHCDLPVHSGDTFEGKMVYDYCTQRHPDKMYITITAVKVTPAYRAVPKVRAVIRLYKDSKHTYVNHALPSVGYYRFATQNLVILPPEDDGLALICDFDGANPDKCIGNIVYQDSLKPCAKFIFFRKGHH